MIYGIGIDLIEVERIRKQVSASERFKAKVYTAAEIKYCDSKARFAESFAARFAVKEAFFKAIGTGWRDGIAFTDIEVVNDDLGKPELVLHGKAEELIKQEQIANIQVSISHVKDMATAIVILEK